MTPVVVDTSVASASGGPQAVHPVATVSRDLLITILKVKRPITLSAPLSAEWKKHMSRFARTWLVSMYAKKLVGSTEPPIQVGMRNKIASCGCTPSERELMEKDFHLLDASYDSNGPVASLDDSARGCFARYYAGLGLRAGLHWMNPIEETESGFEWIKSETANSTSRRLADYDPS